MAVDRVRFWFRAQMDWKRSFFFSYHEEGPDGVVEENDGGGHQHGETDELVELGERLAFCSLLLALCRDGLFKMGAVASRRETTRKK